MPVLGHTEGMTKLIMDKESGRVIGAGIVGVHAGELLAEAVLAIEMGATAEDIGLTIHAHPTLSETIYFAAEEEVAVYCCCQRPARGLHPGYTG